MLFGGGMLLGVGEGASMGAIVRECHVKRETQDVMAVSERRMVLNLRYKRVIGQFTLELTSGGVQGGGWTCYVIQLQVSLRRGLVFHDA